MTASKLNTMKKLVICFLLLLTIASCTPKEENTILVQNHYWAKEGKINDVFAHRLYASKVRKKLGLAVGRVLLQKSSNNALAHVIWECEYINEAARKEDVRLLTESGAFDPVTKKMGLLISHFERATFQITK